MKNILVTYHEPGRYELLDIARESMEAAADRWGCEFHAIERPSKRGNFWTQKIRHFLDHTDAERALYLDGDMLIRADCPNPFEQVPADAVGFVHVQQDHRRILPDASLGAVPCVQGGFQMFSKHPALEQFNRKLHTFFKRVAWRGMDQPIIQLVAGVTAPRVVWLPAAYNFVLSPPASAEWVDKWHANDFWRYRPTLPRYIVHFAGGGHGWQGKRKWMMMFDWRRVPDDSNR